MYRTFAIVYYNHEHLYSITWEMRLKKYLQVLSFFEMGRFLATWKRLKLKFTLNQ